MDLRQYRGEKKQLQSIGLSPRTGQVEFATCVPPYYKHRRSCFWIPRAGIDESERAQGQLEIPVDMTVLANETG